MKASRLLQNAASAIADRVGDRVVKQRQRSPENSMVRRARTTPSPFVRHVEYSNPLEFRATAQVPNGMFTVWHRGLPIDMSLSRSPGKPLIVVFHAAVEPDVRLPRLAGRGVTRGLDVSRLSISDPSLYLNEELTLGWFAGSLTQPDLGRVLGDMVERVRVSVAAERVILFGGSGGGFAALRLAPLLPRSTAIVMNPQTDIERYHPSLVQNYVVHAWGGKQQAMTAGTVTRVIPEIEERGDGVSVYYMQNSEDHFHVKAHLEPFVEAFHHTPGFHLLRASWGNGHAPPPKELIAEVLKAVSENDSTKLSESVGFIPM